MPETNPLDEFDSLSGSPVPGVDTGTDGSASADDVERYRQQVEAQRALYLRVLADFDNYKKRVERDQRALSDFGRRELIKRLLPIVDNLSRAAAYRQEGTPAEKLVDGVLATTKQLDALLAAEDVRPIETVGKPFDPAVSEAVGTAPAPAGVAEETVVAEARRGYTIGGEVLRPAQVIVAKRGD
ncbi:MAG TPA: nucleotide exchange factor GrpE [Candidatus Eremiobacteraceae bacterium]|nr:nucleotide exchange factor GrpE [Candidatus Eremiobacteraceae bacterium]